MSVDLTLKIGGEAGQGMQTIGYVLSKTSARGGFYLFANQDYMSRIRDVCETFVCSFSIDNTPD